jgi:hypothetical protein
LRGFEDLAPWVQVAEVDHFADALRGEPRSTDGARAQLEGYAWNRVAERALGVYDALADRSS